MAVHAQYLSRASPHDHRAIRPALDNATSASAFRGEPGGGGHPLAAAVGGGNTVLSDLTCNNSSSNDNNGCFLPRKRARVGDVAGAGAGLSMDLQGQRALLPPVPAQLPVPLPAGDVHSWLLCSAAASTSGRPPSSVAPVSQDLLSRLYRHGVEIDALVRIENERLRAGLQEARRRHVRTVVSAVERAAARRLRAAEAELERALVRNAELDARLRQTEAEGQAWQDIARCHEGVAAGLRATLDNLMQTQSPCAGAGAGEGDAEDAQSCCFELGQEQGEGAEASGGGRTRACRWCGAAEACVLLLPCRHLCLCRGCEAGVQACPVCAATKNASLHVLLH
ncbi:probable BOI-related E3 ubiquitin-protein ligase 2 [Miscanthus floridulus]|uniref:probable BOI-related E3 ubiquitin-protein ligase 2 n=1 Tax=Miscanthus floridulus TaxID=154761 RepID=UPI00345B2E4D